MIAQVTNETYGEWYRRACAGKLYFDCVMPVQLELFGKAGGGYFAGEKIALDANGKKVIATGTADPDELASFLSFLDKHTLLTDGTVPTGWQAKETLHLYGIQPGQQLPLLPRPKGLTWNEQPSAMGVTQLLFEDAPNRWDDFYAEICTKRNHGKALVWTVEDQGRILSTAGAYAMENGQAYIACCETVEELRGRGIGGWLITCLANTLAAQGWQVLLLAREERMHLYERLGFSHWGTQTVYTDQTE